MRRQTMQGIFLIGASFWFGCGDETTGSTTTEVAPVTDAQLPDASPTLTEIKPPKMDAELALDAALIVDAQLIPDQGMVDMEAKADMSPPDAALPPPPTLRFVALGDTGKANNGQQKVADAMVAACDDLGGCDFALLLGDIIYDSGVANANDEQWGPKFETPYALVPFPFYATLGNHDYGAPPILQSFAGGIGIDPTRGQAQIDYARIHENFILPDAFYRFNHGPVDFVSLNTTTLFWRDLSWIEEAVGFSSVNERQRNTLPTWAAQSLAPWRIAFGHHPYLSNGQHGNAGTYDGVLIPGFVGSGTGLKDFFEDYVIGQFDVYICGHDHNLQDLGNENGTELFVSGAGASAKTLDNDRDPSPAIWQAAELGFFIFEVNAQSMTVYGITVNDGDGPQRLWTTSHQRTIQRPTP